MNKLLLEQIRDWHYTQASYYTQAETTRREAAKHIGFAEAIDEVLRERVSVPEEMQECGDLSDRQEGYASGWNACRAETLATTPNPDGYTALLSDGKRYWSDKPGQQGEWFPYYLGAAVKKSKE